MFCFRAISFRTRSCFASFRFTTDIFSESFEDIASPSSSR